SRDIRTDFQYSNLGYNVASIVAERITGQSWEELTRARIAEPLKMPMTFTVAELVAADNAATPYLAHREQRQRTKFWPISATAAGGINTSVAALANSMASGCCPRAWCATCRCRAFTPAGRNFRSSAIRITAWALARPSIAASGSSGTPAAGSAFLR